MTALSRELIVAAKARADAATEGPWGYYTPRGGGSDPVFGAIPGDEVAVVKRPNDWRLIAAARADVPVMADALLRVLDLHHAVTGNPDRDRPWYEATWCAQGCDEWPCATVRAVTGEEADHV